MKVLICGSRDWKNMRMILERVNQLDPEDVVIHGGARGADMMAENAAKGNEIAYRGYPAQWDKYGKAAGPIRNQRMLDEESPDLVLAFHHNLAESKGTKDMVSRARKRGIEVVVIGEGS